MAILRSKQDIIQLLQELEKQAQKYAIGLPQKEEGIQYWSGIAFRINQYKLIVSLEQIREVLAYPNISLVPGSKNWVRGIANVRGNLLPVFDLRGFLDEKMGMREKRTRILSMQQTDLTFGLVVNEVYGMKYFDQATFDKGCSYQVAWKHFLQGGYYQGDEQWVIFDMMKLANDPEFLQVAVA